MNEIIIKADEYNNLVNIAGEYKAVREALQGMIILNKGLIKQWHHLAPEDSVVKREIQYVLDKLNE